MRRGNALFLFPSARHSAGIIPGKRLHTAADHVISDIKSDRCNAHYSQTCLVKCRQRSKSSTWDINTW